MAEDGYLGLDLVLLCVCIRLKLYMLQQWSWIHQRHQQRSLLLRSFHDALYDAVADSFDAQSHWFSFDDLWLKQVLHA